MPTKIYTKYFDYAFMIFGVYLYGIHNSQLDYTWLHALNPIFLVLSCGFSLLSILHNYKWNIFNRIAFLLLFCISVYLRLAYKSNVLASTMLILAAYNIPFSHIAKMCNRIIIIVLSLVLSSMLLGITEDRLYDRSETEFVQNRYAHDLGFKYYAFYASLGMGVMQCSIYLWRHNIKIIKVTFLIILAYLIFQFSSTRMQLYAYIVIISTILIVTYVPKKILNNKLLGILAVILYPLICFLIAFVSKYHILSLFYDGYAELNQLLNGRLALNEEAFMRYDVTLWGNELDLESTIRSSQYYFFIDSGYVLSLLGNGLIFTSTILILYCILVYKIYKAKAYYLYLWIILYAFLNITTMLLINLLANPILLLAFSDVDSIHNDYYSEEKS